MGEDTLDWLGVGQTSVDSWQFLEYCQLLTKGPRESPLTLFRKWCHI